MKKFIVIMLAVLSQVSHAAPANSGRSSGAFQLVKSWLGEYYLTQGDPKSSCVTSFEVFVKRGVSSDTLTGIYEAFQVGFPPELEMINAAPHVSDAGGFNDRSTSFKMDRQSFEIVDTFTNLKQTLTLTKKVVDSDTFLKKEIVTASGVSYRNGSPATISCEYSHFLVK